jgi:photosystem II Psb28-2 protein
MITPTIEFFKDIQEELFNVRLSRDTATGVNSVMMYFEKLHALERFQSFTGQYRGSLYLQDEEGIITVEPSFFRIMFGGDDGDELLGVKCGFPIANQSHWERFMRFMARYAQNNAMEYGDSNP